ARSSARRAHAGPPPTLPRRPPSAGSPSGARTTPPRSGPPRYRTARRAVRPWPPSVPAPRSAARPVVRPRGGRSPHPPDDPRVVVAGHELRVVQQFGEERQVVLRAGDLESGDRLAGLGQSGLPRGRRHDQL